MPTKFTLKLLQTVPAGTFVASNILTKGGMPIFAEQVAPLGARQEQWRRIKACGAAQRMCQVFWTKEAFQNWLNTLKWLSA
jgi:hypothetical protein